MHLIRPHRPLVKPRSSRPLHMLQQDVHDWLNRHGIPDPVFYFAFFEGAGNVAYDLSLSRTRATFGPNCTWGMSPHGIGLDASANDLAGPSLPEGTNYPFQLTGDQCTLLGDTIPAFADHTATESYIYDGNGDNTEQIRLLHRDDLLVWRWRVHADSTINCDYEPSHNAGDRLFLVGTYDGSNQRLYQDTGLLNSVSNTGNIVSAEGDQRAIGRGGGATGGEPFQGIINQVILWDKVLSVEQFGLFFEQPYAALQPRAIAFYSYAGSAINTSVSGAVQALVINQLAGTVAITIAAAVQSMALVQQAGSVHLEQDATVVAALQPLALTQAAGAVHIEQDAVVAIALQSLTMTQLDGFACTTTIMGCLTATITATRLGTAITAARPRVTITAS